ncbi:adenylyltransferase/cytidyltransferase family protein [Candidatus Gracilibacteria bacterium]|nr:adenylyltransferase/cytidyltransferase family protein [Candidatus Gracilibacteria bacterium]
MKIGLYIGRFQPFHNGHKLVVDTMLAEVDTAVVCIGLSEGAEKNPYDYHTRLHFLTHLYPNIPHIHFFPLADLESDTDWIKSILELPYIGNSGGLIVYCGDRKNDSALQVIEVHQDMFEGIELNIREISRDTIPVSGTEVRKDILAGNFDRANAKIPVEVSEILKNGVPRIDF